MNEAYYQHKSVKYGMGHTRLRRILALIGPIRGKRVLDVGCARGYLGARLKDAGNYVAGVEISPDAAAAAKAVLDAVYEFDIQRPWPVSETFDVIIMSEVLEHVFDPETVLAEARKALNPGGFLIITVPNFLTWTNRLRFLFGSFRYADQGMFDFGHVRWFTWEYLRKVLHRTGFSISEAKSIMFPGKLTRVLKKWPSLFAWQFIVKARMS